MSVSTVPADDRFARERLRLLTVATLLLLALYIPYYVATIDWGHAIPRDGTTLVVGRDFLNFWMYGRAAWEPDPARYYDVPTYWAATEAVTGAGYPTQLWSYPPNVMLLAAPFGLLPYFAALAIWTAMGLAAFLAALRLWTSDRRLILPLLFAPAALMALMSGQFAFLAGAAILAILRWRESRPVVAGILLGLLTLKPQVGLFFPLLLLATRNWRLFAAASVTALAIAGATAALWGPEIWTTYVRDGIAHQSLVLKDPEKLGGPFMPTIFMNMRLAGLSYPTAMAVQAAASLAAAAMIWRVFSKHPSADDLRANSLFLAACVFGTPYLLSYDTLTFAAMATLTMVAQARGRLLPLLVWLLPLIQLAAGSLGVPGPAIIPLLFAWQVMRQEEPAPRQSRAAELSPD